MKLMIIMMLKNGNLTQVKLSYMQAFCLAALIISSQGNCENTVHWGHHGDPGRRISEMFRTPPLEEGRGLWPSRLKSTCKVSLRSPPFLDTYNKKTKVISKMSRRHITKQHKSEVFMSATCSVYRWRRQSVLHLQISSAWCGKSSPLYCSESNACQSKGSRRPG